MSTVGTNVAEPPFGQVSRKAEVGVDVGVEKLVDGTVRLDSVDPRVVMEFEVVDLMLDVEDNELVGTVPTELVGTL